jgi:hypothetical protein
LPARAFPAPREIATTQASVRSHLRINVLFKALLISELQRPQFGQHNQVAIFGSRPVLSPRFHYSHPGQTPHPDCAGATPPILLFGPERSGRWRDLTGLNRFRSTILHAPALHRKQVNETSHGPGQPAWCQARFATTTAFRLELGSKNGRMAQTARHRLTPRRSGSCALQAPGMANQED